MVDNSIGLCNPPSGRYFVMRESREPFFSRSKAASEYFCEHLHQISRDLTLHLSLALAPLKRRSSPRDTRAPREQSIVEWFFPRPSQESGAGSVAPAVCHLVLAAAGALLAVIRVDAQNGSRHATIPDGPAAGELVETWPRSVLPEPPRASRTVRFTRSIKAVFNRPEKPSLCKATVRASCVPSRITGVTRTSLRRR
jgi:hypothetical protein